MGILLRYRCWLPVLSRVLWSAGETDRPSRRSSGLLDACRSLERSRANLGETRASCRR